MQELFYTPRRVAAFSTPELFELLLLLHGYRLKIKKKPQWVRAKVRVSFPDPHHREVDAARRPVKREGLPLILPLVTCIWR